MPIAATHIYEMSFFTGFGVSALVYYTLNYLFPVPGASVTFEEVDESAYDDLSATDSKSYDKNDTTSVSVRSVHV